MKIEKDSLVILDFTGRSDGYVFDTTEEEIAKKNNIELKNPKPIKIVIGKGMILPAIEEFLIGKEVGEYTLKLEPEKAFGKKRADLVMIIPIKKFKESNLNPYPGMVFNADNTLGVVKRVESGRVLVDFNHPLAGKEVEYDLKVRKIINDLKEKTKTLLEDLNMKTEEIKEGKEEITIKLKNNKDKEDKDKEKIEKYLSNMLNKKVIIE